MVLFHLPQMRPKGQKALAHRRRTTLREVLLVLRRALSLSLQLRPNGAPLRAMKAISLAGGSGFKMNAWYSALFCYCYSRHSVRSQAGSLLLGNSGCAKDRDDQLHRRQESRIVARAYLSRASAENRGGRIQREPGRDKRTQHLVEAAERCGRPKIQDFRTGHSG